MRTKHKAVIGEGTYQGERVIVCDALYEANGIVPTEYMINYNGPVWVPADEVTITIWYI